MAEGRPVFLDEESNSSFMKKKLGEESTRRSSSVPAETERLSSGAAAAIRAIVDDDDDDDVPASSSSTTTTRPCLEVLHLDVAAQSDAAETSAAAAAEPTTTTLWTRLQAGWEEVEDRLVEWFGLDQSKYQWAVDEMLERQLAGDQPTFNNANEVGLQMQNFEEQSMQRDSGGSNLSERNKGTLS